MALHSSHTCPPSQNTQTHTEETLTQALSSNESFSYNWIRNMKKPTKFVDSPSDSLRFSLDLEADNSKASKCTDRSSFHFDLPGFGTGDMSIADQMIRDGSLVPLNLLNQQNNENENNDIPEDSVLIESHLIDTSKMHRTQYRHVDSNHPITPISSPIYSPVNIPQASNNSKVLRATKHKLNSFEGSGKPSKRTVMRKYLRFFLHFCKKVKNFGMAIRRVSPRASDDAAFRIKSGCSSPFSRASDDAAFRRKSGCSSPSCDVGREIAIREAILHCKSSSRKYREPLVADQNEETNK